MARKEKDGSIVVKGERIAITRLDAVGTPTSAGTLVLPAEITFKTNDDTDFETELLNSMMKPITCNDIASGCIIYTAIPTGPSWKFKERE